MRLANGRSAQRNAAQLGDVLVRSFTLERLARTQASLHNLLVQWPRTNKLGKQAISERSINVCVCLAEG